MTDLTTQVEELYLIVKRDLYYRPEAQGYTGIKDHAGRWPLAEAKRHESPDAGVTIIAESEAPEYTGSCFDDLKAAHLKGKFDALLAMIGDQTND
jgi:hypothetical protein